MNTGDTVSAAFDGVVRYAKYNRGGFGYLVILRHYNGLETYYAHLSRIQSKGEPGGESGRDYWPGGGPPAEAGARTCISRSVTRMSRWTR
ncbi:MAG: M23 family metallopeptidase [Marinilabiliales bacterium]|nr:M23 family metallopeptidase [Marinilabiliales bacterium]